MQFHFLLFNQFGCSYKKFRLSKCSFNIPSGFAYTNYVRGLSSTINGNIKEANDIVSQAKKIDNVFNLALETIRDKCSSLDTNLL